MDNNKIFIKKMVDVYASRTIPKTIPNAPKLHVGEVREVHKGHYIVDISVLDWGDVNVPDFFDQLVKVNRIIKSTLSDVNSVNFNPIPLKKIK